MSTSREERTPWDCAICLGTPEGKVYQCHRGHFFCAGCLSGIEKCPSCRASLPDEPIHCLAAEQAIAALPAVCTHCEIALSRGEVRGHEAGCALRPVACAGCSAGCAWSGAGCELEEHESSCVHVICERMVSKASAKWASELQCAQAGWAAERDELRSRIADLETQLRGGQSAMQPATPDGQTAPASGGIKARIRASCDELAVSVAATL